MDIGMMNNYAVRIIYDDPRTEEYRQKYQDALDEIQRLNRIIEELNSVIRERDDIIYEMSESLDELGTDLAILRGEY
jgi:peptidoglycan hydrolase CwlO-like protein